MTDFLGNLILRSAGHQSPFAILQPRLPSLFEPLGGENEIPMPSPDPVLRETVAPTDEPSVSAPSINELPTSRSTIAVEPVESERTVKPVESRIPPAPEQTALPFDNADMDPPILRHRKPLVPEQTVLPPATETQQEVIQPVQPVTRSPVRIAQTIQFISHLEEPQRTIMPRLEDRAVRKELPAIEDHRSATSKERGKISPTEPLSVDAQKVEMIPLPTKQVKDPLQVAIRSLKEDSIFEDSVRSIMEPASVKTGSKPRKVLQPVPTAPRPARIQQFEQTQAQTLQRVVEIHIGRIEVRAPPLLTPLKRASQKATTMSLEEYLRSRPGEKQ